MIIRQSNQFYRHFFLWMLTCICFLISTELRAQHVPVVGLSSLSDRISVKSDTTYVLNFWATWCAPCVRELPHFDSLSVAYSNQKIKFLFASLDDAKKIETRVLPFLKKLPLHGEVFVFDEPDPNTWIPIIEDTWTGSIPATIVYNNANGRRIFFEQELSATELAEAISRVSITE